MDSVVCLGLHVNKKTNQYVAVISTPYLLMNPLRALQPGLARELYGDATHQISHHLVNLSMMAVNDMMGSGHLWRLMIQPHGTESGECYKQFYCSLLGGIITVLEDVPLCDGCEFCDTMREVRSCDVDLVSLACDYIALVSLLTLRVCRCGNNQQS